MSRHPTSEQLAQLLDETLQDTDRQTVEAHVDRCADCQQALARITSTVPDVDWRTLQTPTVTSPEVVGFLNRLKQTPPSATAAGTLREGGWRDPDRLAEWQQSLAQAQEFVIVEKLGHGGFGVVYKAYDTRLEQPVALKVLHPDLAEQEMQRARFEREARKAAAVRHDHVVAVHRLGHHANLPFIVMEFVQGEPLSVRLKRAGKLDPLEAAEIVRQVALGLAAAHAQNVVHRDIKPSNILLDQKTGRAKIADFGIAREMEGAGPRVTSTNERPGTLEYMSPEHLRSADKLDGRSDLYSLGVVLYELLTGAPPFRGQTHLVIQQVLQQEPRSLRSLDVRIPGDLETITLKCLAKEPDRRYQSAQELAEDLQRFLNGEPILARRVTGVARTVRWLRRRPAIAGLLAASVVALLALVGAGLAMDYNASLKQLNDDLTTKRAELTMAVGDLNKAKGELEQANAGLQSARNDLEQSYQSLDKTLYVTRINVAHQAWDEGNIDQASEIINEYQTTDLRKGKATADKLELRGFEWYYLKGLLNRSAAVGSWQNGTALAVFPGGKMAGGDEAPLFAVAGGPDAAINFWQPAAGSNWKLVHNLPASAGAVSRISFSPDGKFLAGLNKGVIRIWKIAEGKVTDWHSLESAAADVTSFALTSNGMYLVSGHGDGNVRIWDVASGKIIGEPLKHDYPISQLDVSADGKRLVCGMGRYAPDKAESLGIRVPSKNHAAGLVYVWDDFLTQPTMHTLTGHADLVTAVAISPDGKTIASAGFDHSVRIWSGAIGLKPAARHVLMHRLEVLAVAFSADGKLVASAGWDKVVRVWESATGHPLHTYVGHRDIVKELAFVPGIEPKAGGGFLVSRDNNGEIRRWPLHTDQRFVALDQHDGSVLAAALTQDGKRLVTLDKSRKLRIWEIATQKLLAEKTPSGTKAQGVAISPTSNQIVLLGTNEAELVQLDQGAAPHLALNGVPGSIARVAFSAAGKHLAIAGSNGIAVWDLEHPQQSPRTWVAKEPDIVALTLTPDGQQTAFVIGDGTGLLWKLNESQPREIGSVGASINQAVLSSDGKLLALANDDYTVTVWDVTTKRLVHTLKGHMCYVSSVAFTPDGKRLASGSEDWTIRIWELDTGLTTLTLKGHTGRVLSVGFDATGQRLVSTSEDGTARVWEALR
jgi:WD40 repeat protein